MSEDLSFSIFLFEDSNYFDKDWKTNIFDLFYFSSHLALSLQICFAELLKKQKKTLKQIWQCPFAGHQRATVKRVNILKLTEAIIFNRPGVAKAVL